MSSGAAKLELTPCASATTPPAADRQPHRRQGRPPRSTRASPMVDARLPDGSRVNAVVPPVAVDGALLSIRKFSKRRSTSSGWWRWATMPRLRRDGARAVACPAQHPDLRRHRLRQDHPAQRHEPAIGAGERMITIEDAAELQLQQPHVARMETRPPNIEGKRRDPPARAGARTPCACGPTGSSSARSAPARPSTCCRP
jgi:hypothetical protein